ncbi:ComF family protein [Odoribacter laneus]|jgi:hypothetical protein|uniref:ComF family protein n=2 Tax=Odoribacter laneus TaxID=626933 RepID=UPI00265B49BE|nr:phosphoribosyltransferase family protein [Odoribacter laneus]
MNIKMAFGRALADLFFPRLCMVCECCLRRGEVYICSACLADFPCTDSLYQAETTVLKTFEEACRPEKLYSLFYYSKYSDYRKLVYALKYRSGKKLGIYLGKMLGEKIGRQVGIQGIVPIPLHPKREKKRGYNQSLQIALGITEILNIPIYDKVITRTRNTASQTGMSIVERQQNVRNIFDLQDCHSVRGKHLLIVDDVITTGATMRSCVETLAQAGNIRFSLGCLGRTWA